MSILDIKRLDQVDWDFPMAGTELGSVHKIHWFPGNFIPQIPAALIQILSKPGDLVLDPFVGSGTTAIEALKLGRHAIVSDRISACVQISEAKLSLLTVPFPREGYSKILSQLAFDNKCRSDSIGAHREGSSRELEFWYESTTLAQLHYIWSIIEHQPYQIQKPLFAVFSDLLFACASTNGALTSTGKLRRHHWGWVADNVRPKKAAYHNAVALFRERIVSLIENSSSTPPSTQGTVIQQDARHMVLADESIDIVVTSPPYIGVIDYTHANRLLYMWMGWSMETERADEIGARYRRGRKHMIDEYLSDLRLCRNEIYRVLRKGSYCAIVIGESKKFPNTANRVIEDFSDCMPIVWGPRLRYISRRRVSDRQISDPVEYVCVFQKI